MVPGAVVVLGWVVAVLGWVPVGLALGSLFPPKGRLVPVAPVPAPKRLPPAGAVVVVVAAGGLVVAPVLAPKRLPTGAVVEGAVVGAVVVGAVVAGVVVPVGLAASVGLGPNRLTPPPVPAPPRGFVEGAVVVAVPVVPVVAAVPLFPNMLPAGLLAVLLKRAPPAGAGFAAGGLVVAPVVAVPVPAAGGLVAAPNRLPPVGAVVPGLLPKMLPP